MFIRRYLAPSFYEALFVFVVSNAWVLALVFVHLANNDGARLSTDLISDVISRHVQPSETLVYVLALIAPAAWIMMSSWRARKHVGFYWILFLIQGGIVFGSAILYSMGKSTGIKNESFAESWAQICLVAGVLIWYVTLVYDKWLPRATETPRRESGQAILAELEDDQ